MLLRLYYRSLGFSNGFPLKLLCSFRQIFFHSPTVSLKYARFNAYNT